MECCAAQRFTFFNKELSLGLSFIIKATSAFVAPGTVYSPLGSCFMAQYKKPSYLLLLGSYLTLLFGVSQTPVLIRGWDATLPRMLRREQHLIVVLEPGTSDLGNHHPESFLLLRRGDQLHCITIQNSIPSLSIKVLFASPTVCCVDPISFPMQLPRVLCSLLCLTTSHTVICAFGILK